MPDPDDSLRGFGVSVLSVEGESFVAPPNRRITTPCLGRLKRKSSPVLGRLLAIQGERQEHEGPQRRKVDPRNLVGDLLEVEARAVSYDRLDGRDRIAPTELGGFLVKPITERLLRGAVGVREDVPEDRRRRHS